MEIDCICDFLLQVPKIHDQEIPEKEQPERLASSSCQQQGVLRAQVLPDQQRGWGGRWRWIGCILCCT